MIHHIQLTYFNLQYFFIIALIINLFPKLNSSIIASTTRFLPKFSLAIRITTALKSSQKLKIYQKVIIVNLINLPNHDNFALNNNKNANIIVLILLLIIW